MAGRGYPATNRSSEQYAAQQDRGGDKSAEEQQRQCAAHGAADFALPAAARQRDADQARYAPALS